MILRNRIAGSILVLLVLNLWACGGGSGESTSDPTQLVFVFQKQKNPEQIEQHATQAVEFLSEQLKIKIIPQVPLNYSMAVQALVTRKADVAYLDSLAFLLARRDAGAEMLLAEIRQGADEKLRTDYDSIIVVPTDSKLRTMEDLIAHASDIRFVFTSEISTSGYLMAVRRLVNEGLLEPSQDPNEVFKSVAYGGGYAAALRQVLDGRGDVCAVSYYTMEGPRADVYLSSEERGKMRILARTSGVPTHVICVRGDLSDGLKGKIKTALLKLSREKAPLLTNVYGAIGLAAVDEDVHVAATVEALRYVGKPVDRFVKKKQGP